MFYFHKRLLLRTPAYSYSYYREAEIGQILRDPYFQAAILLASPLLYRELAKKDFDPDILSEKMQVSLRRYFNRMCHRPTPFGLFAGIATLRWLGTGKGPVLLADDFQAHAVPSAALAWQVGGELLEHELRPQQHFWPSPCLYRVMGEYRYLYGRWEPGKGRNNFAVGTVERSPLLQRVLDECRSGRTADELLAVLQEETAATTGECNAYLGELRERQLLVSDLEPTLTGEEYSYRLLALCQSLGIKTARVQLLESWLGTLRGLDKGQSPAGLAAGVLAAARLFPTPVVGKSSLYVNLKRNTVGGLPVCWQDHIREGIGCLQRLVPIQQPRGLQAFVTAFRRRFDRRTVPLLEALDPETGVGYEGLIDSFYSPPLLDGVTLAAERQEEGSVWTPVHSLLLNKWKGSSGTHPTLDLDEEDLASLPPRPTAMPPGYSTLFRILKEHVFLESVGGASATSLLGRFTPVSEEVQEMAGEIARQEAAANPDILFAEIAFPGEVQTADINRRGHLWEFEIPLLGGSGREPARQLPLHDLYVQLDGERVVLWSRQHVKEVVPRLTSAFNYRREDLAVLRFLCDLQFQGIQANLTLDLKSLFPNLGFYPRVTYKSCILHLATWQLTPRDLEGLQGERNDGLRMAFEALRSKWSWPRHVALTVHDQQLVFDLAREQDVQLFCRELKGKGSVSIQEHPFLEEEAAPVRDMAGRPYTHQFLAALLNQEAVYQPIAFKEREQPQRLVNKRWWLPSDGWLYLKVYCHPARADELLLRRLGPLLERLGRESQIQAWFFLRFQDPGHHLRLRIRSEGNVDGLVYLLSRQLQKPLRAGLLQDLQFGVYERELERYGPRLMDAVEEVFCADSVLVLQLLKGRQQLEVEVALLSSLALLQALGLDLHRKVSLLQFLYEGFFSEFEGTKKLREQLSRKFRAMEQSGILPQEGAELGQEGGRAMRQAVARWREALGALAAMAQKHDPQRFPGLVQDVLHLHLNRLFPDRPREQELVLYYCLWRHCRSLQARAR